MMETEFYVFTPGWSTQFYFASVTSKVPPEFYNGMKGFKGTLDLQIIQGKRPADMIRTALPGILIVSERFLEVLRENSLEKWETYPVNVSGGEGDLPQYFGLIVLGQGGPFLPDKSEVMYGSDGKTTHGMMRFAFDTNKWDGSDLFTVPEFPNKVIVTDRVKKALTKAKLKNCCFTSTDEPTGLCIPLK